MEYSQLIALIRKYYDELVQKYAKLGIHKSKKEIFAEAVSLAIEEADIKPIYDAVVASAPYYDIEEIKTKLNI